MKKILCVLMALMMTLALTLAVSAADETEIVLDADHVGESSAGKAETVTIADGTITGNEIALFSLYLPENVPLGETVVVHIKGSADGDFRVWLLAQETTAEKGVEVTFSNQWKASENGFTAPGEFEKYIELTAEDYDAQNATTANRLAFKGPSFGVNLSNLTISYVGVIKGSMDDVEASAVAEAQPFADAANAALEAANAANGDEAALNSALADAQAAVDALTEKSALGFPGVNDMLKAAKDVVKEIEGQLSAAAEGEAVEAIQADVDAVAAALEKAKGAGEDLDALNAALSDAKAAAEKIAAAAEENGFSAIKDASKNAESAISEIEGLVKTAEDAKKAAEEAAAKAAEEAAAKKKQTTTIVIIVVVVVVVVVAIGAVLATLKKKKK